MDDINFDGFDMEFDQDFIEMDGFDGFDGDFQHMHGAFEQHFENLGNGENFVYYEYDGQDYEGEEEEEDDRFLEYNDVNHVEYDLNEQDNEEDFFDYDDEEEDDDESLDVDTMSDDQLETIMRQAEIEFNRKKMKEKVEEPEIEEEDEFVDVDIEVEDESPRKTEL